MYLSLWFHFFYIFCSMPENKLPKFYYEQCLETIWNSLGHRYFSSGTFFSRLLKALRLANESISEKKISRSFSSQEVEWTRTKNQTSNRRIVEFFVEVHVTIENELRHIVDGKSCYASWPTATAGNRKLIEWNGNCVHDTGCLIWFRLSIMANKSLTSCCSLCQMNLGSNS